MNQLTSTLENFLNTIPLRAGDKILAAVSGGADSVAMLHLLKRLFINRDSHLFSQSKIKNQKSEIFCAHINHRLRGKESDADEQFVSDLCIEWNIPLYVEQVDVKSFAAQNRLSIETAARQLRLDALERIARQTGCTYIATAHHKDDQAETVLFRMLRGTAFAGLAGIRPVIQRNGLFWIRPMLSIRRQKIESYCKQNNIPWRDDASNIETHFRRNWIRHRLLPHLQKQSKTDLTDKLAALSQSALKLQQYVESAADDYFQSLNRDSYHFSQSKIHLQAAALQNAGPFVAGEILRRVLTHLGCGLRDMTLSHYQKFFQLLNKTTGTLQLPDNYIVRKKDDSLIFEAVNSPKEPCLKLDALKLSINNNQLSITQFGPWSIQTRIISITQKDLDAFQKQKDHCIQWFDYKQIQLPIIVRSRRKDDIFTPFGHKTKKRISRFLTDSQINSKLRDSCFVIEDKSAILWLAPVRRSNLALVISKTIHILEIRINKS